jgi:predicted transposase YdaD
MFGLSDLKQTRVYQEGKTEGKLESGIAGAGFECGTDCRCVGTTN